MNGEEVVFEFNAPYTGEYEVYLDSDSNNMFAIVQPECDNTSTICDLRLSNTPQLTPYIWTAGDDIYIFVDCQLVHQEDYFIRVECLELPRIPTTTNWGVVILLIILGVALLSTAARAAVRRANE